MRRLLLIAILVLPLACSHPALPLDRNGRAVDLAGAGGVTVLHFWGSWCGPCREELPQFAEFVAHHPQLHVASVAEEREWSGVDQFLHAQSITLDAVYLDPGNQYSYALGIATIPTTLVIDRNGAIVQRIAGPADWSSPVLEQQIENATH